MILQKRNKWLPLLLLLSPSLSMALETDRKQPIFIEAEVVKLDKENGISRYTGNVQFKQGSLLIRGTSVVLYHKQGQVEKAVINGMPASFQQMPDKGGISIVSQAHKMEYISDQSRLFLFQKARVAQGNNIFTGETIEYDFANGRVVANKDNGEGNRINAILETEEPVKKVP